MIQTRTRDEAIEWTRRFPNPTGEGVTCHIEVRQLCELEDFEGLAERPILERFEEMKEANHAKRQAG